MGTAIGIMLIPAVLPFIAAEVAAVIAVELRACVSAPRATSMKTKAQSQPEVPDAPIPIVSKLASGASLQPNNVVITDGQIRELAYKLYEQRGRVDGSDLQDWFDAEAILRERGKKAA